MTSLFHSTGCMNIKPVDLFNIFPPQSGRISDLLCCKLTLSGFKNSTNFEENWPIFRNVRLCQEDPEERGCQGILQGLHSKLSGHHSLCRH